MGSFRRLWWALGFVVAGSLGVLGYYGRQIAVQAPPIPERVVSASGRLIFSREDILRGQNVWQSLGGHELGSVWGHGSYIAPDWSADWLHREALWLLHQEARRRYGRPLGELGGDEQAVLRRRLAEQMRRNTYRGDTGELVVSNERAEAIEALVRYYDALFGDAPQFPADVAFLADGGMNVGALRRAYAMPVAVVPDPERRRWLAAYFFWAAWSCTTERPDQGPDAAAAASISQAGRGVTYTSNWPPEPLVENRPTAAALVWSVISFVLLLAGIGALAWHYACLPPGEEFCEAPPERDPLLALRPTPSMRATVKYFWTVFALLLAQVGLGAVTAHYGVEGDGFYGIPLSRWLPYTVTRTWHVQLGILWIATAWLATGLFVAPAVSGHEPKYQHLGVHVLYGALLVVVLGTLFGTWFSTRQKWDLETSFWLGHQGYEYIDLGRFWQLLLFGGLILWVVLMLRALWPALRRPGQQRHLLVLFLLASLAISGFYAAGLMWGRHTHLALVEYWRWWVVHLWVEGFFEVFATVIIAFLFTRMGLLRVAAATSMVLFSSTVFLFGGIIGTFHHLYFSGTPTAVMALGATFSALEVVPLVLMGFEAYENLSLARVRPWVQAYQWPIYFFVAVAFWNFVGAGLFGFFINPPIALYYMKGLNTTPVHGHTALFGVYGMLGIGLSLFCLKGLSAQQPWRESFVRFGFWAINVGLALMVLLSLLPVGLLQAWASVEHGLWYARSAEFLQTPLMNWLRWMRIPGDTLFALGVLALVWFVVGLKGGWSLAGREPESWWQDTGPARAPVGGSST
jgi:nitric oxide reductase subunit B